MEIGSVSSMTGMMGMQGGMMPVDGLDRVLPTTPGRKPAPVILLG